MTIETEGGTTFTVLDGNVTITRHDQPEITIPEDDMEEFMGEWYDKQANDELEADE